MSNPESTTQSPANAAAPTAAGGRTYAAPELTRYGLLQALTAAGSTLQMENMAGFKG